MVKLNGFLLTITINKKNMKLITPEISWHQKEPIFSVHFAPLTSKLASGGADSTVKIWLVKEKQDGDDSIGVEFLANLDRHAKPVNVVRFSPSGNLLASAGDDGTIILWKFSKEIEHFSSTEGGLDDDIQNKENWIVHKMMRGHIEDVYDLAWSPDGTQLISGSVDNSAIIWDTVKGQNLKVITDHKHYVQGVCWDPRNFYVATHSSDRSCRLYMTSNHKRVSNIHKNTMSYMKNDEVVKTKNSRMFMDETMKSFFRRCTFSTDGSYLFLPAGLCDGDEKPRKTTYVFARGQFKAPICHLPGSKKATVAVRCSPICYELIDDKENHVSVDEKNFKVPYRMIYAIASLDSVTFYDTQHNLPIGHCANMHYASLTDMTWSSDGKMLVISSTDGYCSFIKFDEEEFGKQIMYDPVEYQVTQAKIRKKKKKDSKKKEVKAKEVEKSDEKSVDAEKAVTPAVTDIPKELKEKEKPTSTKPAVDSKQPTIKTLFVTPIRKRKRPTDSSPTPISPDLSSTTPTTASNSASAAVNTTPIAPKSSQKPPKRVQVITLSSDSDTMKIQSSVISSTENKNELNSESTSVNPLMSPNNIHKHFNTISSKNEKNTPNPLTSPNRTPKRVTVTTLSTLSSSSDKPPTNPLVSPNKVPKRVSVTTLVTFNKEDGSSTTSVPKSITPSKATYTAVIPPSSPVVKQPKRITVQTLSTFSDANKESVALEKEESPLSTAPVQVDPPQLDDMLSCNSFDAPLIETVLNNSITEKQNVAINTEKNSENSRKTMSTSSEEKKIIVIEID